MTSTAVDNIGIKEHTECMQLQHLTTIGELSSIEQIEWRHVQPTKTVSKHKMVRERANKTMYMITLRTENLEKLDGTA